MQVSISWKFTKCNKVLKNQFKYPLHTLRKHRMSHIISKALCLTFQPVKRVYSLHTFDAECHIISKALCLTFQLVKRSVSEYKLEITKCNEMLKNQFKYPLHTLRKHRMSHIISKVLCLTFQPVKKSVSKYKLNATRC